MNQATAAAPPVELTAVVLTRNEAAQIRACLETLQFADRLLVFDSFSDDDTAARARELGAQVIAHRFANFAAQRNAALKSLRGHSRWALFIDADERVSPALAAAIRGACAQEDYAGWRMPRHNYICGRLTQHGGWFPDYQTRLLRLERARYDPQRPVHEVALLDGRLGTLTPPLTHHNYRDWAHFRRKQRQYAAFYAAQLQKEGRRPRRRHRLSAPLREFCRRYFALRAYRMGWHGLRLSLHMAQFAALSHRLLRERYRSRATLSYRG